MPIFCNLIYILFDSTSSHFLAFVYDSNLNFPTAVLGSVKPFP